MSEGSNCLLAAHQRPKNRRAPASPAKGPSCRFGKADVEINNAKRPSRKAPETVFMLMAPPCAPATSNNEDRAKAAPKVIACVAAKLTSWRRTS